MHLNPGSLPHAYAHILNSLRCPCDALAPASELLFISSFTLPWLLGLDFVSVNWLKKWTDGFDRYKDSTLSGACVCIPSSNNILIAIMSCPSPTTKYHIKLGLSPAKPHFWSLQQSMKWMHFAELSCWLPFQIVTSIVWINREKSFISAAVGTWYSWGPLSSYPATRSETPNGLTPLQENKTSKLSISTHRIYFIQYLY